MIDADWLEITVTVLTEADTEAATEVLQLFAIDDEGVAIEQIGDPADIDPKALLPETLVKLYVDAGRDSAELRQSINTALAAQTLPAATFRLLKNEDWANAWKANFQPLRIGKRFWIKPSWIDQSPPNADDIVLHLDPGMAFGTGTHETTQLCMRLIEQHVKPGQSVLDVGTGSGILAIAAAKLSAAPILAFDNDPLAVTATKQNAIANKVDKQIQVREASVANIDKIGWDVVVVNILAVIIQRLLADEGLMDCVKPNGAMLFSGILASQSAEMEAAIAAVGGTVHTIEQQNDWIAMLVKPTTPNLSPA